jgi:hypothetical protein
MMVRIYQIDMNKVFDGAGQPIDSETLKAYFDARKGCFTEKTAPLYRMVWEGELTPLQRDQHIFREFNRVEEDPVGVLEHLDEEARQAGYDCYNMNSLSVGDLIVDMDVSGKVIEKIEIVAPFSFESVSTGRWAMYDCDTVMNHGPIENRYWKQGA